MMVLEKMVWRVQKSLVHTHGSCCMHNRLSLLSNTVQTDTLREWEEPCQSYPGNWIRDFQTSKAGIRPVPRKAHDVTFNKEP